MFIDFVTLDDSLPDYLKNPILLIDVEGAELLVIRGGKNFIINNKSLIIFEYNTTSKKYFNIEDISKTLKDYRIFRLNSKGLLDNNFSHS